MQGSTKEKISPRRELLNEANLSITDLANTTVLMDLNMEEKIGFKIRNLIWHLLPPILFVLIMLVYFPFGEMFEMDLDEGINLIRALLVIFGAINHPFLLIF